MTSNCEDRKQYDEQLAKLVVKGKFINPMIFPGAWKPTLRDDAVTIEPLDGAEMFVKINQQSTVEHAERKPTCKIYFKHDDAETVASEFVVTLQGAFEVAIFNKLGYAVFSYDSNKCQ